MRFTDGSYEVLGACIEVHRRLGPGLLESAYQNCLASEFAFRGIRFQCQPFIDIQYRDILVERAFQPDFIVDGRLVVELKSVAEIHAVHRAQLPTYVRLAKAESGLLINFNALLLPKNGIFRVEATKPKTQF